ncbi:MAG: FAD-dependent thymidylate synthase, partial [Halobacteria archaeon]|nr:FAD-dependent thymidylate synthase [Halobacteria archaeon]
AKTIEPDARLLSTDSETVEAVFQRLDLAEHVKNANMDEFGESEAFLRGVFEANGGFYSSGDDDDTATAFLLSDETTVRAFSDAVEDSGVETRVKRTPEGYAVEASGREVAKLLYADADTNLAHLHKSRLLAAMDYSSSVEERFEDSVTDWLDSQQFIYPPSVTQKEIVSRETGRVEFDAPPWKRIDELRRAYEDQSESYNRLREQGVPAEDARSVLGMGIKINMTFTMNARALMHLFDMRAAGDAQCEIRDLSEKIIALTKEWMPTTFEYYDENMKNRKNRLGP